MEMIEEYILDILNFVEISIKFNSRYKFLKIIKFWFLF